MAKRIYLFEEGSAKMRDLLGGKGANLCEMTRIGLPVPYGFVITTEMCKEYSKTGKLPKGLMDDVKKAMQKLEKKSGKKFGDPKNPLLVSVRSGAAVSMPGMMDTVLNLGLNDETLRGLAEKTQNERYAYDCYRRFINMFGDVVMGVEHNLFEKELQAVKDKKKVKLDTELNAEDLKEVVERYKKVVKEHAGRDFPTDPYEQLRMAIEAVFRSWDNPRAKTYRKINKIPEDLGTAVNIQMMVFGNMGDDSGTGVGFTRDPSTGENKLYGEYLMNAQGEDVVAGIRTPKPLSEMKQEAPKIYAEIEKVAKTLEKHYKDMQDFEFTIEKGKLYMLQTRTGKRTAQAAVRIAVEMVKEKLITKEEAVMRVDPAQIDKLLHRQIDPKAKVNVIAKGLPASPGAAAGHVVFDADLAEEKGKSGEKVILVRPETTPEDIHGIVAAQGVLTSRGGMTSHAAVVARGMGKPCVAGCDALIIDLDAKEFRVKDTVVKEWDYITIDGGTGNVILGEVPTVEPTLSPEFKTLLSWADNIRRLGVRANADTPEDAARAFEFGAEGVGLCRTEHMFMAQDRLPAVQEMIMASSEEEMKKALDKILPMQRSDFIGIFKAMKGHPVTIRLIDPPLHEFLPNKEELLVEIEVAKAKGEKVPEEKLKVFKKVQQLFEFNPMLGLRGCRLIIVNPLITDMQVRAIFEAAVEVKKQGVDVKPEVMIPLVGHVNEIKVVRERIEKIAEEIIKASGVKLDYKIGTMIELPRAALTAGEIAKYAEFFSFGTNDLTQTTFGFSRDDAEGKFLALYVEKKILPENPFVALDREGVGRLMRMGVEEGRKTRKNLKVGICGEHGGEPSSVEFCHMIGLDYVSCSPFRVPIARLAAAQAALREKVRQSFKDQL
ncbi:MAG: pyruvate, phosphate dikinase [Candidatus Micrarchaeia archaeon]